MAAESNETSAHRNETSALYLIETLMRQSDSRVRPGVYGPATVVKIDLFVQSFGPLNEMQMEFSIDIDFRQTWLDPRLIFNTSDPEIPVYIPHHNIEKFWIPDTYFPNEKSGTTHSITLPNKSVRIYSNGTVRYFSRMPMSCSCTMYLANFPLDHQTCRLKISTYSYDEKEVKLEWADDDPIEIHADELNLPQFDLAKVHTAQCNESYKTGNYSCVSAVFRLRRKVGFFVLQTYIPSMLIVMLSWVGFWINKNSEPARVALGVTTVLTMTTQLSSSVSNTMRVSYPKALDVWYSACMVFVFGALLEYAFVNVFTRSEKKIDAAAGAGGGPPQQQKKCSDLESQKSDGKEPDAGAVGQDENEENEEEESMLCCTLKDCINADRLVRRWNLTSKKIDRTSRRVFPVAFFLFNVAYWLIYTVIYADGPLKLDNEQ